MGGQSWVSSSSLFHAARCRRAAEVPITRMRLQPAEPHHLDLPSRYPTITIATTTTLGFLNHHPPFLVFDRRRNQDKNPRAPPTRFISTCLATVHKCFLLLKCSQQEQRFPSLTLSLDILPPSTSPFPFSLSVPVRLLLPPFLRLRFFPVTLLGAKQVRFLPSTPLLSRMFSCLWLGLRGRGEGRGAAGGCK
ncbi:hypothetical protein IE53DRAFT_50968 [Violaceomyces palustris]|uniref:Uncharacterized protein n=1 Tax=Violaceomyces palustris TaxID=1673888 RepID=A0ACD0P033_9BASI|nr:hypothetical protein IE53DRAFT_50968 [Violaceomyces palustris]